MKCFARTDARFVNNPGYHGNAESYLEIGEAMARALLTLSAGE